MHLCHEFMKLLKLDEIQFGLQIFEIFLKNNRNS